MLLIAGILLLVIVVADACRTPEPPPRDPAHAAADSALARLGADAGARLDSLLREADRVLAASVAMEAAHRAEVAALRRDIHALTSETDALRDTLRTLPADALARRAGVVCAARGDC